MRAVLKNKVLVTVIGILLLANVAMLVFFIVGMRRPPEEPRRQSFSTANYLQKEVGFSEEQLNKFTEIRDREKEKVNVLFDQVRSVKDSFFIMLRDPSISNETLEAASARIGAKQKALDMQVFLSVREIRNICTPEQQAKFDSIVPKVVYKIVGSMRKRQDKKEDSTKKSH